MSVATRAYDRASDANPLADSGAGLQILAIVFGLWLVLRSVNKDSTGRTLIDHILGRSASQSPLLDLNQVIAGAGTVGGSLIGTAGKLFSGSWTPGRLDKGYDGTFTGQLLAPFSGTITYASNSFSNWGGYLNIKSDSGTIPGLGSDTMYFAEGLTPLVRAGQRVTAGQPIAAPSGQGPQAAGRAGLIEMGAANPGSVGTPSDPISASAAGVMAMAAWLEQKFGIGKPSSTSHAGLF